MDTPLFLYRLRLAPRYDNPAAWSEDTEQTIGRHAEFLDELGRRGHLVFAGRTLYDPGDPRLIGFAVVKAASAEEAERMVAPDPAVLAGIQLAEVHPFGMPIRHLTNLA
jgi:uncharacterized protein YciI